MVIKVIEVYQNGRGHSANANENYSLRETFINPEHVVCLRSDITFKQKLQEGLLPNGLDSRQEFTRVYMNRGHAGLDIVVVGEASTIEQMVSQNEKTLLKG
tara:strand:+ start:10210 stop:10512 length:303 start_codon:yes stop_codon:yes gene_type:complete